MKLLTIFTLFVMLFLALLRFTSGFKHSFHPDEDLMSSNNILDLFLLVCSVIQKIGTR